VLKEPLNNRLYPVSTQCINRHLRLVKVISAQSSHYVSAFLLLFLKKGRLPPVSGYGEFSPCHGKRIQIGTSEHGVQSILVLPQSTIHGFPVAELTLDDSERLKHCNLSTIPKKGTQTQAPQKRAFQRSKEAV